MIKKNSLKLFKNFIYTFFLISFSLVSAEETLDKDGGSLPSSQTVIYIGEGTQTNLLEVAETGKAKLIDKRSKNHFKKKKKYPTRKKQDQNPVPTKIVGKTKENNQTILNYPFERSLFLSGYSNKILVVPTSQKIPLKMLGNKFEIRLFKQLRAKRQTDFYFSGQKTLGVIQSKRFTRPPPFSFSSK